MADISQYLQAIMTAVYGEEVRGSIHDAIALINSVGEVTLKAGTDITSASSPTTGYYDGSLYINTDTDDLWECTGTAWELKGNIRGTSITSITKTDTSGLVDTYTITLSNGTTINFTVTNGSSIASITKTGTSGLVDTYTITLTDGTVGGTFMVTNGQDGQASTLSSLTDVDISSPVNRQILRYNGTSQEWENSDAGDLTGYNRTLSEAEYMTLKAQSDPVQGTGVYDPDVYFFITNVNAEGWVETAWLTATANSTTALVFNSTTIGATNAASIHPTSTILIRGEASDTKTMPLNGNNTVKPIYARVDYQDEGECQIIFEKQPVNTDFQLWIRND